MKKRQLPKPNTYAIMTECVEAGLQLGFHRAHKHTDKPSDDCIRDHQLDAIMGEIDERFYFDFNIGKE